MSINRKIFKSCNLFPQGRPTVHEFPEPFYLNISIYILRDIHLKFKFVKSSYILQEIPPARRAYFQTTYLKKKKNLNKTISNSLLCLLFYMKTINKPVGDWILCWGVSDTLRWNISVVCFLRENSGSQDHCGKN